MKRRRCWALCAALLIPGIVSLCGCDKQTYSTPEQTKAHMAAKEKKEANN